MKQHKPRSVQRQAVLKLFETQDSVTKYSAAEAIGLSAMAQDNVIARGPDIGAKSGSPLRTFIRARKAGGFNPFLVMAIRRRTNEQLGITP